MHFRERLGNFPEWTGIPIDAALVMKMDADYYQISN
jgi:hypothetical protein